MGSAVIGAGTWAPDIAAIHARFRCPETHHATRQDLYIYDTRVRLDIYIPGYLYTSSIVIAPLL